MQLKDITTSTVLLDHVLFSKSFFQNLKKNTNLMFLESMSQSHIIKLIRLSEGKAVLLFCTTGFGSRVFENFKNLFSRAIHLDISTNFVGY